MESKKLTCVLVALLATLVMLFTFNLLWHNNDVAAKFLLFGLMIGTSCGMLIAKDLFDSR